MAMSIGGKGGKGGRRRGRRALASEINVTPFVDVMLVLLIVFMITAPLLTQGVDVALPNTKAHSLPQPRDQVLTLTVQADGKMFLQEEEVKKSELQPKLKAIIDAGYSERIYLRADEELAFGDVAFVLARIQEAGFNAASIVTDPNAE